MSLLYLQADMMHLIYIYFIDIITFCIFVSVIYQLINLASFLCKCPTCYFSVQRSSNLLLFMPMQSLRNSSNLASDFIMMTMWMILPGVTTKWNRMDHYITEYTQWMLLYSQLHCWTGREVTDMMRKAKDREGCTNCLNGLRRLWCWWWR